MSEIILKNVNFSYPILQDSNRSIKKMIFNQRPINQVQCIKNFNLEIKSGERVGIVGHNGAGKTTFLKLLSKIYSAQSGQIDVNGKVTSLLNINLGINDELSGLENIKTRGLLMGLSKTQILSRLDDIVDFTELGDFIHFPVKTYSAGMRIRLAFSVCTSFSSEILIMDEWLSAGDESFQIKANARLEDMLSKSNILILASHDLKLLRKNCNRLIELKNGSIVNDSEISKGINRYLASCRSK